MAEVAGPDLDARVARALGWVEVPNAPGGGTLWREPGLVLRYEDRPPDYSTEPGAALYALDGFDAWEVRHLLAPGLAPYEASATRYGPPVTYHGVAGGDTLPLAVCGAILAALEGAVLP